MQDGALPSHRGLAAPSVRQQRACGQASWSWRCLCLAALVGCLPALVTAQDITQVHVRSTHLHVAARKKQDPEPGSSHVRKLHPGSQAERSAKQSSIPRAPANNYLAMCIAVKDQHADIREWVEYHHKLGAGKFYIFDNNSTTPMLPMVYDLAMEGLVEYVSLPEPPDGRKPQLYIYDTCLQKYGSQHTWMAFTDADEFFVLRNRDLHDLPTLLRQYEQFGALAVNWQMFGSSGFLQKPTGNTLESYFKCFPRDHKENLHIKTIANVQYTTGPGPDPHQFRFREGYFAVDEQMHRVEGPRSEHVHIDQIALYHYATKSRAEYMQKIKRGSAMRNQKTIHFFELADQEATANCTDALLLG